MTDLAIGDLLYTAKDAGYLEYLGNDRVKVYLRLTSGKYELSREVPLTGAQKARWIELKARDGAVARMDPKA